MGTPMKPCKHRKILYTGIQETHYKDKYLFLFNCVDCNTTLAVPGDRILTALIKALQKLT
ncbi:hypothetical protein ES703_29022 [subsurface metagenome]